MLQKRAIKNAATKGKGAQDMPKTRAVLAVLFVCVVGGATSATASAAPQYVIEATEFNGEESISAQITSGTTMVLKSKLTGGATFEMECSQVKMSGGNIKEKFKGGAKALVFEKCKVKTPATCKVSETITTNEVVTEAIDVGVEGVSDKILPRAGETLVTINVTGCAGEGSYRITGTLVCQVQNVTLSGVTLRCTFTLTSGSTILFGPFSATFTLDWGTILTGALNLGKKWLIRH